MIFKTSGYNIKNTGGRQYYPLHHPRQAGFGGNSQTPPGGGELARLLLQT